MNGALHQVLHYLALPGHFVNDTLHISQVGMVQYGVGALLAWVTIVFVCALAARWRVTRHLIYAIGAVISLFASALLIIATTGYAIAWPYTGLIALIFLDVSWQILSRQKALRLITILWAGLGLLVMILTIAGTWLTLDLTKNVNATNLTKNTAAATTLVSSLKNSVAVSVEKIADSTLSGVDLNAVADHYNLNFVVVQSATGTQLAASTAAPRLPPVSSPILTVDTRGLPVVISSAVTATGSQVIGGVYLDNARLTAAGLHGGIMSPYGLQSSANLTGHELMAVNSADTRTWVSDNKPHTFSTETVSDRLYLQTTVLDANDSLSFVTISTDQYAVDREHGSYAVTVLGIAALILLLAIFIRSLQRIILPIGIFGGLACALAAVYLVWVTMAYMALHTAYPLAAIRLDHPALTPAIYFHPDSTGLTIQVDTDGANIATLHGSFTIPPGITASEVVLDPNFCTVIEQAPIIQGTTLTFTCSTPNPPLNNQLGNVARITAPADVVDSGNFSLVSGYALARTGDTSTEQLPLRAFPITNGQ